jgi:hypothetical protein
VFCFFKFTQECSPESELGILKFKKMTRKRVRMGRKEVKREKKKKKASERKREEGTTTTKNSKEKSENVVNE